MRALRILGLLAGLAVVAVLIFFATMPRPGSRTRAYLGIVNTLRQIDGAKQQYAIDHNLPAETLISREQLAEYLREEFWNKHADYHINAIGVPPEAVLPRAFDGLPAKTVIRLHTNDLRYDIVPPNQSAANRRPAGQADGSDNLFATVAADRVSGGGR
jgi:hypothetical protein